VIVIDLFFEGHYNLADPLSNHCGSFLNAAIVFPERRSRCLQLIDASECRRGLLPGGTTVFGKP
jgi:hypothetical protein